MLSNLFKRRVPAPPLSSSTAKERPFTYNGHNYLLVGKDGGRNWHDARKYCQSKGSMDLSVLNDQNEFNAVRAAAILKNSCSRLTCTCINKGEAPSLQLDANKTQNDVS